MAEPEDLQKALARIVEQQEALIQQLTERAKSAQSTTSIERLVGIQAELSDAQVRLNQLTEVRTELESVALKKNASDASDRPRIEKEITQTQQQREQAPAASTNPPPAVSPAAPSKSSAPSIPSIYPPSNKSKKPEGLEETGESEKAKAIKKAKEVRRKFENDGLLNIQRQRAMASGRYREAFNIDLGRTAGARFGEVRDQGGTAAEAMEAAQLTLGEKRMDVRRGLGSLGRAKDSRGNLAALHSLASNFSTDGATEYLRQIVHSVENSRQERQAESAMQTHR